jgi:hypothetical protein
MAEDTTLKPPEGWVPEGGSSTTEIREPSDSNGPEGPNSDWMYESKPAQRNPATDMLTGAVIGAGSKLVNPITEKVLEKTANKLIGPEIAGAKSSIYHPQPSTPVAKWTRAMHTGNISAAKDARHFAEANQKMMEFYEAEKKLEALRKAEALFQTEEQIRKSATPVTNVIRTASEVMSPTGESLLGKAAGFGAQTLGRALAGGSAAYQGVDAYNRFKNDDYLGGTIGTLGAIGSGVALIPTPITRVVGTGVGLGAEGLNYLLDKYRASQQPGMAQGGSVQHYDLGGPVISAAGFPAPQIPGTAGTLATTETPVGLLPSNLNDFVTGGGKFNPTTGLPSNYQEARTAFDQQQQAERAKNPFGNISATVVGNDQFGQQFGYASDADAFNQFYNKNYAAPTTSGQTPLQMATPTPVNSPATTSNNGGLLSLLLNTFKTNPQQIENKNVTPLSLNKPPVVTSGLSQPGLNQPTPQMTMPTRRFGMPLQTRHQVVRKPQGYFR